MSTPGAGTAPAPVVRRVGRPGHDLAAVLTVAVEVFNRKGFEAASMTDIARDLGVGKSAIYHHVDSKDSLLGLALDHALAGLEDVADSVRAADTPAMQRLQALVRGAVEVLVGRLPYVTLLLRLRGNSELERRALQRRRAIDALVADLVRQAIAEGSLRADLDPATTARLIFGTVNSLIEWLRPGSPHTATELSDGVVTVMFDGLRPR